MWLALPHCHPGPRVLCQRGGVDPVAACEHTCKAATARQPRTDSQHAQWAARRPAETATAAKGRNPNMIQQARIVKSSKIKVAPRMHRFTRTKKDRPSPIGVVRIVTLKPLFTSCELIAPPLVTCNLLVFARRGHPEPGSLRSHQRQHSRPHLVPWQQM